MSPREERERSVTQLLAERFERDEDPVAASRFVTGALGLVASVLVAASTFTAVEAGYTGIGLSFLAAVALFLATVAAFEAGHRLGADD